MAEKSKEVSKAEQLAKIKAQRDSLAAQESAIRDDAINEIAMSAIQYSDSIGVSPDDLIDAIRRLTRKGSPVHAKYTNPANVTQFWSGKGRQPQWVRDHIAAGNTMDSLLSR